ncbi:MAG: T9SS type A sorting domain-containing protein [Candidatus Marinimicrobia bacterium]|nr:T9SS type A sorting domain-containing protein [Candidatus Neomarinimicrobiota bacterium]
MPVYARDLTVALIRVEFQTDDSPATTGDGTFVLQDTLDLECPDWELDPPPHNDIYFKDHLLSAHNYWAKVSNGNLNIDTLNSKVFPLNANGAYLLPHDMLYYHPYLEDFDETRKLFELSRDAIAKADPDIDFNHFTTVIIVHAGMGGDFDFALDPTPGNIPSAYLSPVDFDEYGVLQTADAKVLDDLIIIPESQNFQQYKETIALFEDAEDPCFYQVGLNGTLALMFGFHLGLPPLYNTESGRSLVGGFALMDQGSNNFHGIVPAYPDPFTRIEAGWVIPNIKTIGDTVQLGIGDPPVKVEISENEYYLIENHQRNMQTPGGLDQWIDEPGEDTVSVRTGISGVVIEVDEQDAGLPGNGLFIWHIDESARFTDENPNGGNVQLVDFIEADGAQDMGFTTQLIFREFLETGWWFDPWFAGNEGWFDLNRTKKINQITFGPETYPSTKSNSGIESHLRIDNISANGSTMSFTISSERVVEIDSISSIIGWSRSDSTLWAFNKDSTQILLYSPDSDRFVISSSSLLDPDSIFNGSIDDNFTYHSGLIAPHRAKGVQIYSLGDGYSMQVPDLDSLFELSEYQTGYKYFAKHGNGYVSVFENMGQTSITSLPGFPLVDFSADGSTAFYGNKDEVPIPVAIKHTSSPEAGTVIISWSTLDDDLMITKLDEMSEKHIQVEKPMQIIPFDADGDGAFEIALFYSNVVQIINQVGVVWNGSPFPIDPYYGNPLIASIQDDELSIFLRHQDRYSLYSIDGRIVDQGTLPSPGARVDNSLRGADGFVYILSGNKLLYFASDESNQSLFWIDPQGSAAGDRTVWLSGTPSQAAQDIKKGTAFNYPNPIKGSHTTVRAWLGDVDKWSIEIFSLNGAQIAFKELEVEQHHAYNEWDWDASAVSNGVYLAQIVAGDSSEIIKIAIIR